jgi:DNA-directed RNA polymerase specialized sigma24 family protein
MRRNSRQNGTASDNQHEHHELQLPAAIERPEVIHRMQHLIRGLVYTVDLHEDLLQECLIHFWHALSDHPDKTFSWYLQSCHWHLTDWLRRGRSLDSIKNRGQQCAFDTDDEDRILLPIAELASADNVFQNVAVRDIIRELSHHLAPPDTDILHLLTEGHRPHEIAHALHLPQREVSRSRARIADVALTLKIRP